VSSKEANEMVSILSLDGGACCPSGCRLVAVEEDDAVAESTVSVWSRRRKRCFLLDSIMGVLFELKCVCLCSCGT